MKLLATLILAAFATAAHARVGETEGQSQARYGQPREDLLGATDKPLMPGSIEKCYLYQEFRVRASFAGGVCHVIEYAKVPENGVPKQLSELEVRAILVAESGFDPAKLAAIPKEKQFETALKRWKEDKVKDGGPIGDIARGIQGALKLHKWERADRAVAEFALGLVLKVSGKDADSWAKRLARSAKPASGKPGAKPGSPPAPAVPKF